MDNSYSYPDIGLINSNDIEDSAFVDKTEELNDFFSRMGVNAFIHSVEDSITSTLYALELGAGVRVSKITGLKQDISVVLDASDIVFQIPIPGTSFLGIQAVKRDVSRLLLGDLISDLEFIESDDYLEVFLGRMLDGSLVPYDFSKFTHLLIAGTTGSGKSVFIDSVLISILFKASPKEVQMLMIDTHSVSLVPYNGIPHLLLPVITEAKKAAAALNWVTHEMDRRYSLLAENGARSIDIYNSRVLDEKKLSHIIIVIDDFADIMASCGSEVEENICRIAQKSRAAGIHLIIATQRPSANVLTGNIKANIPNRIAFATASNVDSRVIIDSAGAEHLKGKGEMLFKALELRTPIRIQAPYISEAEVDKVIDFIRSHNVSSEQNNIVLEEKIPVEPNLYNYNEYIEKDPLLIEAAYLVVENQKASIGYLQRNFRIMFNRAARIMDQLHELGIVGPEMGTKPREIRVSRAELEAILSRM